MKYHISLRTHILVFGISAICFITGVFLIIYGTISLRDANDKLKRVDSLSSLNVLDDTDISIHSKNDLFQKSNILHDQNLTQSSPLLINYLMTLVLTNTNYYADYNSMAQNAFYTLENSLTGSNSPSILQVISLNQIINNSSLVSTKADVYMLTVLTYIQSSPSLNDLTNSLQKNSIDVLSFVNMSKNYYPSQESNQNCGCFNKQSCPRMPTIITTTTIAPTTSTPCTTEVCKPNVLIAVDTSSDKLIHQFFEKQITFLQYNLSSGLNFASNGYCHVALVSYNENVSAKYNFGTITTTEEYLQDLYSMTQYPGSNLTNLFTNLATITPNCSSDPISTFVMISEFNKLDVINAVEEAKKVAEKGSLNFIILGTAVKQSDLSPFYFANIQTWELGVCDEDSVITFFNNNLACPNKCTSPCTPGTVECNTIIAIDTSSDILSSNLYNVTIQTIQQNISTQIQDIKKIGLLSYDFNVGNYHNIGSIQSKSDFNTIIGNFKRNYGSDLKKLLQFYISLLNNANEPLSFITFISEKPTIDMEMINYANQIKSKAKLNFIILGTDLKMSDLQPLAASSVYYFEFGECNIDGLVGAFNNFTTCNTLCSSTTTTTTTSTTTTTKKITKTTVTTIPPTTTTQCIPHTVPCNPNLIFAVDSSNDVLEYSFFQKQINYLQNDLSTLLSNYDFNRVTLASYSSNVIQEYPFGNISNYLEYLEDLQNMLSRNQSKGSSLTNLMKNLNNLKPLNPDSISTYIFVSEINDNDVQNAVGEAKKLKSKGELNFILLGTAPHASQLGPLQPDNIINWLLSDCEENNVTDLIHNGFVCHIDCGITTTTLPPPTTTCQEMVKVCYSNIRIYVDSSNDILYPKLFDQEISFLTNNLTKIIPYNLNQLAISSINKNNQYQEQGFGYFYDKNQLNNYLLSIKQGPGYNLSNILYNLFTTTPNNNYPTSTFVFLSDSTKIDLTESQIWAEKLSTNNNSLYFILLGTAIKLSDIKELTKTDSIIWQFSECSEEIILEFFNDNFICDYKCKAGITTTTTTTPEPCVDGPTQCYIVIAMDTSSDILIPNLYQSTLNIIQHNVSQYIYDFSKVALVGYDSQPHQFQNFNSIKNREHFNSIVASFLQHSGSNLASLLQFFINAFPENKHMSYVVFISENQKIDSEIRMLAQQIMNKGRLEFIILGTDINPSNLISISSSQPLFYNFGDCDIKNLTTTFQEYINCNNICSTTPLSLPSTIPPKTIPPKTLPPKTIPPITLPPTTTCRPITKPCNSNLMFAFDASSVVIDDHYFNYEKLFFSQNLSAYLQSDNFYKNNYDHIALIPYDNFVDTSFTFGKIYDNIGFINDVNSIKQGQGNGLTNLLTILNKQVPNNNDPISTYIFLSNVTDDDIQNSILLSKTLLEKGNLNFIIFGSTIQVQQLDPLYKTNVTVWLGADCQITDLLHFIDKGRICNDYCLSPTITPTQPIPTCPQSEMNCDSKLIVGVDVSNDKLSKDLFDIQISFLDNNLTTIIDNFATVDLAYWSSNAVNYKEFGLINNVYEWDMDLHVISKNFRQSGSNLSLLLSTLSGYLKNYNPPGDLKPISTYIFISNNDTTIPLSVQDAHYISSRGSLNFIILGTAIKPQVLQQLVPSSNIFEWEIATCTAEQLLNFIKLTRSCYCPPATVTPTVIPTTTASVTPKPNLCDLIISIDNSNDTLFIDEFNYEKNVIINNITTMISDYSRVALSLYSSSLTVQNFGTLKDSTQFNDFIKQSTQQPGTNLTNNLYNLNLVASSTSNKISTFVFIGTKDQNDLQNAVTNAKSLNDKGNLYFIIVGTYVTKRDLINLTPLKNIYVWDFANCPISQLMKFINQNSICDPEIVSTTKTPPIVKPSYYVPCKSSLIFAVTTSSDMLDDDLYQKQLDLFTKNYIIDEDFNHFERIAVATYNQYPEVGVNFNEATNSDNFNLKLSSKMQKNYGNGNNLTNLLEQLTSEYFFNYDTNLIKNYFIFISNLTSTDITTAKYYADIINHNNDYLNFIILDNTDPLLLKQLNGKNILTWSNDNNDVVSDFLINYIYCNKKRKRSLTIGH
ncbi:von Willebrand factor, type A domain-containing protein [Strongyloides ratti]|uniref:von Willebrand factor, type A domain-containing protein n=1 Tax=Strongyloides ratti TaxID=34506 RepID=A0A090KUC0_STRRB|nr:von Willebrand factor, type A domain-containing protein [Strongyloides ratti]CEF59465.1 von Willebrand factor, type A domain-containing protein [Strongyloides ratti]